jgi:hypothetical protein
LWNWKVHFCIHKEPLMDCIPRHMNLVHIFTLSFTEILLNIIPSTRFLSWDVSTFEDRDITFVENVGIRLPLGAAPWPRKKGILSYRSAKTSELTFLGVFCTKFVNVLTICVQNWTALTTEMLVVIAKAVKVRVSNLGSNCQRSLNLDTMCYQFTVNFLSKLHNNILQSLLSYVIEHSFLKSWWPIRRAPHWALYEPVASYALHTLFLRPVLILYKALCA